MLQIVTLVAVVFAVWGKGLVSAADMQFVSTSGPIHMLLCAVLGKASVVGSVIAIILVLLEGYLLTDLLYREGLIPINTLMPMLLYVMVTGMGANVIWLSPVVVANLFIILALRAMMIGERMALGDNNIFNTSIWFSIACLTWLPAVAAVVTVVAGLLTFKVYKAREWGIALLGFAAPIIVLVTTFFLIDKPNAVLEMINTLIQNASLVNGNELWMYIYSGVFGLLLIVASLVYASVLFSTTIAQRKGGFILLSMLICGAVSTVFEGAVLPNGGCFAIVAAAAGTTMFLTPKRKLWIYDIVLLLMVAMSCVGWLV